VGAGFFACAGRICRRMTLKICLREANLVPTFNLRAPRCAVVSRDDDLVQLQPPSIPAICDHLTTTYWHSYGQLGANVTPKKVASSRWHWVLKPSFVNNALCINRKTSDFTNHTPADTRWIAVYDSLSFQDAQIATEYELR
jgi:hypothetical protein